MTQPPSRRRTRAVPGLTACSLCAGETLEGVDPLPGGQLARLRDLERTGRTRLTLVECLDRCERGDVVVVRPVAAARRQGTGPVWFERLAGDAPTAELAAWLASGGPGVAPMPAALTVHLADRAEPDGDGPD